MMKGYLCLLTLVVYVVSCEGYDAGAPTSECTSMKPGHGSAQSSTNPYTISHTGGTTYTVGTAITVTVGGTQSFQGILIECRQKGTTTVIGSFGTAPSGFKTITCTNSAGAITQSSSSSKNSGIFTWNPPATSGGDIEFVAVVLSGKSTWWQNTKSSSLTPASGYPSGAGSFTTGCPMMFLTGVALAFVVQKLL